MLLLSEPSPNADRVGGLAARTAMSGLAAARGIAGAVGRPLSRLDDEERTLQCYWDLVALAANLHTFTPAELGALGRAAGFGRGRVRAGGATSILWAVVYYVLAGELPALAGSRRARRVAREIWHVLRAVDRHGLDRALPARAGLTVQAVFWDPA